MTLNVTPFEIVAKAEASGAPGLLARHESWERVELGAVADIVNGAPFPSKEFNNKGEGMPLVRIRDVVRGVTDTYYSGDFSEEYLVRKGDLLVGMDGDFSAACWSGPPALLNQRVCKVQVVDERLYDSGFLRLVLQGYLDAIWHETSSITVKHLSSRSMESIPLPLPPLAEQRRIVAVLEEQLSRLEKALFLLAKSRSMLETYRLAKIKGSFSGSVSRLGDIFQIFVGVTPSRRDPANWRGNIPWVSSSEVAFNRITETRECISEHALGNREKRLHPPGTVMLAMIGEGKTRGQAAILEIWAAHNQNCASIRVSEAGHEPEYVYFFLKGRYEETRRSGSGGNQPALNKRKIQDIEIPMVSLGRQREVVAELSDMERKAERFESELIRSERRAAYLRRSLLTAAFSGKLVPQDPNDEPASVLLERIRAERAATAKPKRGRRAATRQQPASTPAPPDPAPVVSGEQTALEF